MKNESIIIIIIISAFFAACNDSTSRKNSSSEQDQPILTIAEFMENASESIGHETVVKGIISHVCSHGGKRCFITDGNNSIRIEATGNISAFNNENQGNEIIVRGIVKERRLDAEFIGEREAEAIANLDHSHEDGEHCSAELDNIKEMIAWMEANNKDYFSIYYIDGTDYELINL
ncbi:MAG: OB-fold nucleic acid binding domain-containing protein [Bacteroidota bacterium]